MGIRFRNMEKRLLPAILVTTIFSLFSCSKTGAQANYPDLEDGLYAELITSEGTILISLEYDKVPITVANFVGLVEGDLNEQGDMEPYYDGLTFHRVIANFMIQTGDPTGTGSGGPGYTFPDEFHPRLLHTGPGVVSMANRGPNTNGSQIFITHQATNHLDGKHSVFGRVLVGQEVVDKIKQGDKIRKASIIRVGDSVKNYEVTREDFNGLIADYWSSRRAADLRLIEEKWPETNETVTGIRYIILQEGEGGENPGSDSTVTVNYTGMFIDGTIFDTTSRRGEPLAFPVNRVIQGWQEMLKGMVKGEIRLAIIPPEQGYGEQGFQGVIPPNSFLVFEMELLDFE